MMRMRIKKGETQDLPPALVQRWVPQRVRSGLLYKGSVCFHERLDFIKNSRIFDVKVFIWDPFISNPR